MRTYSRRKAHHKHLPLPPMTLPGFQPLDVGIGMWRYRDAITLRFDIYSQTWRCRCSFSGAEVGEFGRDETANDIAAALDRVMEGE